MKYQENLQKFLINAKHFSAINKHEFITCEHVLFAILKLSSDFEDIFKSCADGELELLENELKNHIAHKNQILNKDVEPINSAVLEDILSSLSLGKNFEDLKVIDFLEGLSKDERSFSKFLLDKHKLDVKKLEDLRKEDEAQNLKNFTTELVSLAKNSKLDPLIGRSFELDRMIQVLSRRKKNNPILVGEAGVGKTAIVEGLALAIHEGRVPSNLKDAKIFSLDLSSLLSGTKYRGDFEKRLKDIVKELSSVPNSILFIDEIHTIVGAGAANESHLDMSNLLKPALSSGALRCIGATTFLEYKNSFDKNKPLSRRFAKIDVDEPSKEESLLILRGLKSKYESFHNVKFDDEVLVQSVELAKKVFSDKHLPDCAIDLIDELGAFFKIQEKKKKTAGIKDLQLVLAKMTHSHKVFELDTTKILKNLENSLKDEIFGQDEAIKELCATIKLSYAGLKSENTPRGVFLFTGSSGVGKTELCKVLARILGLNLERFDMSEYAEKHSLSKLIGAPAGYVGFEDGGLLSNAVRKNPFSVILFDEIEKAHPDLSNTFLQIFDNATLTDSSGLKADFRNCIIVMTSNLGLKENDYMGFLSAKEDKSQRAIKDFFAPEFINRLDKIIHFNDLNDEILAKIVQKELDELSLRLKTIKIKADKNVKLYLAKKAYKKEFGVRPLKRLIASEISEKISDELLFGRLKKSTILELRLDKNGNLEFVF